MAVLEGLKPERVFYYFEEICRIPHGSFHTKEISDYLVSFAKEHGLWWKQDESNNVIIKKKASEGYEGAPTVILQGHCDMVCEKAPGSSHDFLKDPLKLEIEGDFVTAKDTTLGGDDGIAVAYALAILEDDTLKHPALEIVITTDEEVGLLGANAIDTSCLEGRYLINMDSEEEGILWVGCAGGMTAKSVLPVERVSVEGLGVEVEIRGLKGGHSGAEIDKIRANANKLLGRFLYELKEEMPFAIVTLKGGQKDNAIPRSALSTLVIEEESWDALVSFASSFTKNLRAEYSGTDDGIEAVPVKKEKGEFEALSPVSGEKCVFLMMYMPYGVEKMSGNIEGLVETSTNPGVLLLEEDALMITSSVRSSVKSGKAALGEKLRYVTEFLGGEFTAEGEYPAWEYRKESKLRDIMFETYKEVLGGEPLVKAIHAGLECGLFYEKIKDLDCVSFGPTMRDIHTTEEMLSISSTERMYRFLLKVLENIR